jgi:helicase
MGLFPFPNSSDSKWATTLTGVVLVADAYGAAWIGACTLAAGAVVHHGDIPQETREVLELALRSEHVRFVFCTTTLGVNLPIRTLVLYSVQRIGAGGGREDLLARDIKNLVGRAGRAGATTKGLVLAANADQWHLVEPVARQTAGEDLVGALRIFLENLRDLLAAQTEPLTNDALEGSMADGRIRALVEGVNATIVELANEEIGAEQLVELANKVAMSTFAAQGADEGAKRLLRDVFKLRAEAIIRIRSIWRGRHASQTRVGEIGSRAAVDCRGRFFCGKRTRIGSRIAEQ